MIRGFYSHLELCHYETILAQTTSATYAWYVYFSNSNVNYNTRASSYRVRAFTDCLLFNDADFIDFFADMLVAYYECRKKKRSSISEIIYEIEGITNTLYLALDIYTFKYKPSESVCFIIHYPTIREVFCALFRDRICHTWLVMRLNPMLERYLPDAINANRIGKGTGGAVRMCYDMVQKGGWIWKFDIQGFFMSIDKRLLWNRLKLFAEGYIGRDKKWFLHTLELSLFNAPQFNCVRVCSVKEWDNLPARKSLFRNDEWHGLAIGDQLSQALVGFFLTPFISLMISMGYDVVNYVDDTASRYDDKEKILRDIPLFRKFLKDELGLTLHPKKFYLQHTTKGLTFLGAIIKPHRIYCANRTIGNAFKKPIPRGLKKARESVNSYLGYFGQFRTYGLRRLYADKVFKKLGKKIYFGKRYLKMVIPKRKHKKRR